MITIRKSLDRGKSQIDWLHSYHTFSFADYYDEQWMGFDYLRVINEDFIKPGRGFEMHSHHDMEIITYIVQGALAHKDSMGNGAVIRPGEIQRMSAGTGVRHSEFNSSNKEELHLLQIWIKPKQLGIKPGYEQKQIAKVSDQLILIGAPNAPENGVTIHQDIHLYVGYFTKGASLSHHRENSRYWLQLIKGSLDINQQTIHQGDGAAIHDEKEITLCCNEPCEFLLFEMFS